MVTVSGKRVGVAIGVLAVLGVGWFVVDRLRGPEVDPALAAKVLPVIDEELEKRQWLGMLSASRPELGARWFCAERVIEIRRTGDELAVGLDVHCDEFARDGDALVAGSGERGPKVVVLAAGSDGYRVSRVDRSPDGKAHVPWVERNFSEEGVEELSRGGLSADATVAQARRAFRLPSDAPVRLG